MGPGGRTGGPGAPPNTPGGMWGEPGKLRPPWELGPGGLPSIYTLAGEAIDDPGAWQLWWDFNKDPYLRTSRIQTGRSSTLGDDFFLGKGEKLQQVGGRTSRATVDKKIAPKLLEAIQLGARHSKPIQFGELIR